MGRARRGGGVEPRGETIRISFMWQGRRCRETLKIKPTGQNIKAATRLAAEIDGAIALGRFSYAKFFPDSDKAHAVTTETLFGDYADRWLKTVTLEHGTTKQYTGAVAKVWKPALGATPLAEIKHSDIKAVIATRRAAVSGKTINNDLIPLRAMLDEAVADGLLAASPARLIKNLKHQSPPPDPFTVEEMEAILADLAEHAPTHVHAYFEVAFLSGMRPSEQIIARWARVDWAGSCLRIDRAVTRGHEKGTKTNTVRDVDLTPRALAAVTRMKPFTFMKGPDTPIFCHPATGRPWTNDQYQRVTYFQPVLRRLGIRMRDAYQCRHTYATMGLMGGLNPAYLARQLGHKNAQMLFKVYAKWIDGADKGREASRLADIQSAFKSQLSPREGDGR